AASTSAASERATRQRSSPSAGRSLSNTRPETAGACAPPARFDTVLTITVPAMHVRVCRTMEPQRTSRRVTLVADEALGYVRTGGLGTATTFLSVALARMGHQVELLFTGDPRGVPPATE